MNPKSSILVQIEILEATQRLKDYINYVFESFRIDDIVLGIVRNQPRELTTGYMVESKEFDTLDAALQGFDPCKNCIRINEGKYFRGTWSENPVEGNGTILNISNFSEI